MRKRLALIFLLFSFSFPNLFGQQREEANLVRMVYADTLRRIQTDTSNVSLFIGPAQFIHNGALIFCDTARLDHIGNILNAIGNVKITQNETVLTSDFIRYDGNTSIAQVRGHIVELVDKDKNRLRTHNLDYNTRDSTAHFFSGGSMISKDDNVIESLHGYYDSKIEMFKFRNNVEMYADSILIKTDSLIFWGNRNQADFLGELAAWQDSSYLMAGKGWYNRDIEEYFFQKDVYIMTPDNEIWSDTLLYKRKTVDAELYSNIQILDTVQPIIIFADYAKYADNPRSFDLYENPAVAMYSYENGVADTLFVSGDTIRYHELLPSRVDSATYEYSREFYKKSLLDPLKARPSPSGTPTVIDSTLMLKVDSLLKSSTDFNNEIFIRDTLIPFTKPPEKLFDILNAISASVTDSLQSIRTDSLIVQTRKIVSSQQVDSDTTAVKFMRIDKNILFYRSDFQGKCDSLLLNSIDSTIRMYIDPIIWNENRQFTGDSIFSYTTNNNLRRVELNTNAFVIIQQDTTYYNQIKSLDFFAHFTDGELTRFDAIGSASALFFIEEDSILTTMNEKEAEMISALLKDKQIIQTRSYTNPESNAYPLVDLAPDKIVLQGFNYRDSERPTSRFEVCDRKVLPSIRDITVALEEPKFPYTKTFFDISPRTEAIHTSKQLQPDDLKPN
jgi:Organic solvent tolerance protein OstA